MQPIRPAVAPVPEAESEGKSDLVRLSGDCRAEQHHEAKSSRDQQYALHRSPPLTSTYVDARGNENVSSRGPVSDVHDPESCNAKREIGRAYCGR